MSVATEYSRILANRNSIRNTMVDWGAALGTDTLADLATKMEGITNNGAVEAEIREGETYTIPAGYHSGSGTVAGVAGGGNYTLQEKTVTPTKAQQNITPDTGKYGLSSVTVNAIPDAYQDVSGTTATAADVLATKVFIAADGTSTEGTIASNGDVSATFNPMEQSSITIAAGHTTGGTITLTNDLENALKLI